MPQTVRKSTYEDSYRYISGGYIPGSSAPAVKPERRVRRRGRQAQPRQPVRNKPVYDIDIVRTKKNALIRFMSYAAVLTGAFLCVASIAYTESRRLELNALERSLKQLKIDNTILSGEIYESYNLTEIEEYAVNTLGMAKPDESQIIYVDEAKVSYMVHYDAQEEELNALGVLGNMVSSLMDKINSDKSDKSDK